MYLHPKTYVFLTPEDRERIIRQRAPERPFGSGGKRTPGLARRGVLGLARALRWTSSAAAHLLVDGPRPTPRLAGSPGVGSTSVPVPNRSEGK